MDSAWVDKIAVRDMWLHGMQLASAIAYAEAEGWLTDSGTRKKAGFPSLVRVRPSPSCADCQNFCEDEFGKSLMVDMRNYLVA
jgi:hypothetical protein